MKNLLFQLIFIQIGLTLNQRLSASSPKNEERLAGQRVPVDDSNCDSRPGERTLVCAPSGLITSVGRSDSKNGRPDLLSVPTGANVVSGRQYGRQLAHSVSQNPLATTPSGSAWRKSLRAQPARPPRPSDDVSRSHPGARAAPGNHGPSHRRAGRPVSLAGGIGRAPPIADENWEFNRPLRRKPLAWNQPPRRHPLRLPPRRARCIVEKPPGLDLP